MLPINQSGHQSNECPNRKTINIIDKDEGKGVCCEPDGGDEYYGEDDYANDEEAYVIRKLMLAPKCDEKTQRHQLFRTRCTSDGRVFELIVDSGSYENIIGREIVKVLNLPIEKHPNPCTIGRIKAAEKIEVTEQYKVPFSIGKYKDEVYCDIVDIDACHLLFGRP